MYTGHHYIAGDWVANDATFPSQPAVGDPIAVSVGTVEHVNAAVEAAEAAFLTYGRSSIATRAAFLRKIADEIEARGEEITKIGMAETGLPEMRLNGERGRTTGQLRLFADHIEQEDYLDRRHDVALPDRQPLPRPDLKLVQRPLGPVAVFGASNFPLAFSTAGGDTASALAAGCPVVVKAHSAHPGTGEVVAKAIEAAVKACDLPAGVFSMVHGGSYETGTALVQHPLITAVGFTGSLRGGRILFDLCAQRETPIPFFGELGSVNPMFVLPAALKERAAELGAGWAGSLTMGVGQFCTNPGLAVVVDGDGVDAFIDAARSALEAVSAQTMLTEGIAASYKKGVRHMSQAAGVETLLMSDSDVRDAVPALFVVDGETFLGTPNLAEEVFGPSGLVVRVETVDDLLKVAQNLQGQLTCTLQLEQPDAAEGGALMAVLERKAGRVLANGFPTGVEVADSMVHGGPYPASTNFGATSVGTLSIRRWLRPVCFQNIPDYLG